jgi:hypothetical protein
MIHAVPFRLFHVELMRAQGVQGAQLAEVSLIPPEGAHLLGPALSAFDGERILICGGIQEIYPQHGVVWGLLAQNAGRYMTAIHYGVSRFIGARAWRRLEASVEKGFAPGCRWLELLGFRFEGEMPAYGMRGETHLRYGRT